MRISIFCVNHNTHDKLIFFLESIAFSFSLIGNETSCDVFIVDNSDKIGEFDFLSRLRSEYLNFTVCVTPNLGYFPSVNKVISDKSLTLSNYDICIVSNVDMRLNRDFFKQLVEGEYGREVAVVAPSIISLSKNADLNPKLIKRPSRIKLILNRFFFSSVLLHQVMYRVHRLRLYFKESRRYLKRQVIYAPHGSLIIFINPLISSQSLNYPLFLFGEEIYIAELCKRSDFKVIYDPSLIIFDDENASTSKLKSGLYCRLNSVALSYLIDTYFSR